MDQFLGYVLEINLLIPSLHFSAHECPLLELRRLPVKHEDRAYSVEEELADPAKKAIKDAVFIAILRSIHELNRPNTHVDRQRLALEVVQAYAATCRGQMKPEAFHSHLLMKDFRPLIFGYLIK